MPPSAAPRLASSLENEIRLASSAFDAYLIISAVRGFVRMRGASRERAVDFFECGDRPLVDAAEHDAVREHEVVDRLAFGQELRVHAHAEVRSRPSCPTPPREPEARSRSVVPGTTVLFTTTTW